MSVLTTHRFTVEDYYRMAETGVLKPDARVELLDGEIVDMMPIGPFHAGTTNRLAKLFLKVSQERWQVAIQTPVRLAQHSEPQPDLMLLRPSPDDYTRCHPGPDDVLLLIEVADSAVTYDRSKKLPAYGRAGIPEVWIINLPERTVEVCREPHFLGYASETVLQPGEAASPAAFPDAAVDIEALLRQAA
jgi:Uma2 family endonuclease